jgi:lariat debranching enzyme
VAHAAALKNWPTVDLVIICGDFQAVRNTQDLNTMSVPMKYRELGDFHAYYSGVKRAPYLTVFIGGNHEASGHMWELYHGGWAAPNIYYMGAANVLRLGPLRIAGVSGIWKGFDYRKPHFERLPYNQDEVRSIYHVRELDVRKLLQIRTQVDVGLSHDWPNGIEWLGDHKTLFRVKSYFEQEARDGKLGSPAGQYLLDRLRPPHWFSAHMHFKYAAVKVHQNNAVDGSRNGAAAPQPARNVDEIDLGTVDGSAAHPTRNDDEIDLDLDDSPPAAIIPAKNEDEIDLGLDDDEPTSKYKANKDEIDLGLDGNDEPTATSKLPAQSSAVPEDLRVQLPASFAKPAPRPKPVHLPHPAAISNTTTHFLALDKLLPNRQFLQLLEITGAAEPPASSLVRPLRLAYDPEWLAITRAFADHSPVAQHASNLGTAHYLPLIQAEETWVHSNLKQEQLTVPENFELTAPVYNPAEGLHVPGMPREYSNPQTKAYCELVGIKNYFHEGEEVLMERWKNQPPEGAEEQRGGRGRFGGGDRGRGGRGRRGMGRGRGRGF